MHKMEQTENLITRELQRKLSKEQTVAKVQSYFLTHVYSQIQGYFKIFRGNGINQQINFGA